MARTSEPRRLREGKSFHKWIQKGWETAEGSPHSERRCTKPDGRSGRIDIHVGVDDDLVAVVEIKNTDWDRITLDAVRRNVRRQARQIWNYIESQVSGIGENRPTGVCPGIVFPRRPVDPARRELIEMLFEEEGIPVVWDDESIEERRAR
jgi:hypothetical protein